MLEGRPPDTAAKPSANNFSAYCIASVVVTGAMLFFTATVSALWRRTLQVDRVKDMALERMTVGNSRMVKFIGPTHTDFLHHTL